MGSPARAGFPPSHPPIGALLREWRTTRRMSQLDLALEAGMSARHLSYVETGKAQASRELVCRLADVFGMPLRERNALLLAAGYAPQYPENALATPALERMRQAIELIIAHQEPYPAFVIDRECADGERSGRPGQSPADGWPRESARQPAAPGVRSG